jgi:hypothetical protein
MEKKRKKQLQKIALLLGCALIASAGINIYFFTKPAAAAKSYIVPDADQKIKEIEAYLDSISPAFIADEQLLAHDEGWPSWGCGPSSYALAQIINNKFFDNKLILSASSTNNLHDYKIIERFGLAKYQDRIVDHNWLEIYFKDRFLFIDPTIGQFGKMNAIAYEVFTVGDPNIPKVLKEKYGVEDVRLTVLMRKVLDRMPITEEPYPGMTIDPKSIDYFLKALEYRNDVNDGKEPEGWKEWVSFLTHKYL